MTERRKKAIVRRRIFIALLMAVFIALEAVLIVAISNVIKNRAKSDDASDYSKNQSQTSDENSSADDTTDSSNESSEPTSPELPDTFVTPTGVTLDANFSRLLLINGKNPLPDDYDTKVRDYLVEIDPEYRNNDYVTQIHKDVYPYITAMVAAANAEGVNLKVWSPFRDYATQKYLFQNQVNKQGGDEDKAATIVARPGTSEHNTGLCADFNMANDGFESTEMFTWMCENAEDYGFILRYPEDKIDVTGVIYESWHWRFVGINNAREMNDLGLTLEEYIEMKGLEPTVDMYGDD